MDREGEQRRCSRRDVSWSLVPFVSRRRVIEMCVDGADHFSLALFALQSHLFPFKLYKIDER